ncbi:hypothetical protein GGF31_001548 [Allomyces arbusculus]|nr:hypothetical protein GGF31_001548 [Allomyces arbusculus]
MSNQHQQGAHHDPFASANSIPAPPDDPYAGMSPTTRRRTIRDQQEGVNRVIKATQASVARSKPRATSPYLRRKSYSPLHLLKPKTVVLSPEDEAMQASILAMIAAPSSPTQARKPATAPAPAPPTSRSPPVPAVPIAAPPPPPPPPPPPVQQSTASAQPQATTATAAPTRPWNGGPGTSPIMSRRGSPTMTRRAAASPTKGSPTAARRATAISPTLPHRQRQGTDTVAHQQEPDFVRYCEQKPVAPAPTTAVAAVQVSLPPTPRPPAAVQLPAPPSAALPAAQPPNLRILTDATRALSLHGPVVPAQPSVQSTVSPSTLPRSERSVSWAAPPTDTSPTVRANDYGGIFNEYNEYNRELAMPRPQQNLSWMATSDDSVAAIPATSRHASHVLASQDTDERSYMSPFANDDERRAFLAQCTAAAPSTAATERPSGRWSPPSLPRRREVDGNGDEWRAIERPKSADPWVSSKSADASSTYLDAKTNSFRATYATSGTSLSSSVPRAAWLDSSSLSLSLDRSMGTKDTSLYRGLSSDDATMYRRSPDIDATAFQSGFVGPPRPPPSTSEYYRVRTPPPPPSAARPPVPASPPRPDSRAAAANRTDATATRLLQDRERHLTEVVHTLKARLEEEQAQSTHLREHVTWLHDRLRAENTRRAAADAEVVSLRARVMDLEHHVRRGGTSGGDFGSTGVSHTGGATSARTMEPRPNNECNHGNGMSGNDPEATWRASLMRMGMERSPTAAATVAPSYRSDSTILAKTQYDAAPCSERSDAAPIPPLPSRPVRHEVDDPYLMP